MTVVRRALWAAFATALVGVGTLYAWSSLRVRSNAPLSRLSQMENAGLEVFGIVPRFEFRAHTGETVSPANLKGKVWVADFFFTNCRGVCPAMTANLRDVQAAIGDRPDFKLVSFTVDPERDSTKRLSEFSRRWSARPGQWLFVSGEQSAIFRLAREGFRLGASEVPGDIVHSDRFVLVDPLGRIRGYYHGADAESVEGLVGDIRRLLEQPPSAER